MSTERITTMTVEAEGVFFDGTLVAILVREGNRIWRWASVLGVGGRAVTRDAALMGIIEALRLRTRQQPTVNDECRELGHRWGPRRIQQTPRTSTGYCDRCGTPKLFSDDGDGMPG